MQVTHDARSSQLGFATRLGSRVLRADDTCRQESARRLTALARKLMAAKSPLRCQTRADQLCGQQTVLSQTLDLQTSRNHDRDSQRHSSGSAPAQRLFNVRLAYPLSLFVGLQGLCSGCVSAVSVSTQCICGWSIATVCVHVLCVDKVAS